MAYIGQHHSAFRIKKLVVFNIGGYIKIGALRLGSLLIKKAPAPPQSATFCTFFPRKAVCRTTSTPKAP